MGLAERRAQKRFVESNFPRLQQDISAAAHFDLPIEVHWDSLSIEGHADNYDEFWTQVYFRPLIAALKDICADDMGRDALKDKVKKIVIKNEKGHYYGDGMAVLQNGTLIIDHEPATNVGQLDDRTKALRKYLENNL